MSSETGSSCSGTDQDNNAWKYGLAIMASVLSSAGSAGGMILQKWAHNEQQALAEDEKYGEAEGIICSPLWWLGCVVLVLVPVSFSPPPWDFGPRRRNDPRGGERRAVERGKCVTIGAEKGRVSDP